MNTALAEAPTMFVQEPEDFPQWVVDYERAYALVLENFERCYEVFLKVDAITADYYIGTPPLKADFSELNNFIESLAHAALRRCQEDFSPAGTRLQISYDEIPKKLIIKLEYNPNEPKKWKGDPHAFKVSEIYKFLESKYHRTGVVEHVAAQVVSDLIDLIGLNALNYNEKNATKHPEYHDENGKLKPFIERFDALHKRTKKSVIYSKKMYEGYSAQTGIIWNMNSTNDIKRLIECLRSVVSLVFRGVEGHNDGVLNFLSVLEDRINRIHSGSGGLFPLGHEETIQDYRFIFRKKSIELHIPHDMHERILKFVSQNAQTKKAQ